jgi:uncharacterized damage-inducible protein DinB
MSTGTDDPGSDDPGTDYYGRPMPPLEAGEIATLQGFLDFQRATLEWKCRGLNDDQLRARLAPTSMTLAGVLKHMARVEDSWFSEVVGGEPVSAPWAGVDWQVEPDWDWQSAAEDSGGELRSLWAERVARSRAVVTSQLATEGEVALGETHSAWGGQGRASLRWVLVHMIEEYARHNRHADLMRESIDGETGE